jgi:hypothetical protein
MSEDKIRIDTTHGVPFTVRIVRNGESYGLNHKLKHDKDEPLVEFYDARFDEARFDEGYGQFVSRYNVTTLQGRDRWSLGLRVQGQGLILHGGVPEWRVDGKAMDQAMEWVEQQLEPSASPAP